VTLICSIRYCIIRWRRNPPKNDGGEILLTNNGGEILLKTMED